MDQHRQNYIRYVTEVLPNDISSLVSKIQHRNNAYRDLDEADPDDFRTFAHFHATNQLLAAVDALKTLQLLVHGSETEVTVNITQNGVVGLLRQALESLGWARWLLEYSSDWEGQVRGYFFHLEDVVQRRRYYNDLGQQENMDAANKLVIDLVNDGVRLGYYKQMAVSPQTDVPEQKPILSLPSITEICQSVKMRPEIVTSEVLDVYPGMGSASWLYRWASGFAHGKHWVNIHDDPDADGLSVRAPNYLNMTLIVFAIHDLINDIQD